MSVEVAGGTHDELTALKLSGKLDRLVLRSQRRLSSSEEVFGPCPTGTVRRVQTYGVFVTLDGSGRSGRAR